ncbi:hypothetical protein SHIRM173S_09929 [Streptomyces hirsutus]
MDGSGLLRAGLLDHLERPQRRVRGGGLRSVALRAATAVRGLAAAGHPALEVLLGPPAGVDEVGVGALHGTEQLEPLESVRTLHRARPRGEPLLQRLPLLFAEVTAVADPDGTSVVYRVTGELFFASSNDIVGRFDYSGDPDHVVIDLSSAHVWDASSVAALDAVETRYAQRGKTVEITGLNEPSARLHDKLSGELVGGH